MRLGKRIITKMSLMRRALFFMGEDSMIVRQDYEIILKKITIV